jgi:hypothetical protein
VICVLKLVDRISTREDGFVVWLDHAGFLFLPRQWYPGRVDRRRSRRMLATRGEATWHWYRRKPILLRTSSLPSSRIIFGRNLLCLSLRRRTFGTFERRRERANWSLKASVRRNEVGMLSHLWCLVHSRRLSTNTRKAKKREAGSR